MFERFSDDAADVMIAAQVEARHLHREEVGTDHLLLAVMKVGRALAELAPGNSPLLTRARAAAVRGSAVHNGHPIPYDSDAWRVIEDASQLARPADAQTEPEHFLLALLRQQQETDANRLLTALHIDQVALNRWCAHSLAERSEATANSATGGSAEDRRVDNPLVAPFWPRRILEIYRRPLLWGASMEVRSRWHRIWLAVACLMSLCYTALAIAVYRSSHLAATGRGNWYAALLVTITLCFGVFAYWSGKGLAAMAEGWQVAGAAKGCLVVLGYLATGLLPLALAVGAAVGAAMAVFGTQRVTFLLNHLGSVTISVQLAWLLLTPFGVAIAIFASYTPFWHYSVPAQLFNVWWFAQSSGPPAADEGYLPEWDRLFSKLRGRPCTALGAEFIEQYISAARAAILIILYQFSGRDSYLDEALATARTAADVCLRNRRAARNYVYASTALGGLADTLWAIYQIRPDEEALRDAIWAREQLARTIRVKKSGQERRENAHKLARLNIALYELTGDPDDLKRGLTIARLAARAARRSGGSAASLLTLGLAEELGFDMQLAAPAEESVTGALSDTALSGLSAAQTAYQGGASRPDEDDDAAYECRYRLGLLLARKSHLTGDAGGRRQALEDPAENGGQA